MVKILQLLEPGQSQQQAPVQVATEPRPKLALAQGSEEMLAILKRCQDDSGIRRRLSAYKIANKTGSLDALRSDVGIVYSNAGPIAIAITVDGIPKSDYTPDNPGSLLIAELAEILVQGLTR
jgi:beta-lactamase class A